MFIERLLQIPDLFFSFRDQNYALVLAAASTKA